MKAQQQFFGRITESHASRNTFEIDKQSVRTTTKDLDCYCSHNVDVFFVLFAAAQRTQRSWKQRKCQRCLREPLLFSHVLLFDSSWGGGKKLPPTSIDTTTTTGSSKQKNKEKKRRREKKKRYKQ